LGRNCRESVTKADRERQTQVAITCNQKDGVLPTTIAVISAFVAKKR
jgi:hypothetical protein